MKFLPEETPMSTKKGLEEGVLSMKRVAAHINEAIKKAENVRKANDLSRNISDWKVLNYFIFIEMLGIQYERFWTLA